MKIDVRVDSNEAKIKFETISHPKNEDFPSYNFGAVLCLGSWKNNHRFVFQVRKQQFWRPKLSWWLWWPNHFRNQQIDDQWKIITDSPSKLEIFEDHNCIDGCDDQTISGTTKLMITIGFMIGVLLLIMIMICLFVIFTVLFLEYSWSVIL